MKNRFLVLLTLAVCLVTANLPVAAAAVQDDDPNVLGVVVVTE